MEDGVQRREVPRCRGGGRKKSSIIKLQAEKVGNLRKIEGFEGVMGLPAYLILK